MKICLVSPYDYPYKGGVSDHIANLDVGLRNLGHEVKIIAPTSTEADDATAAKNFYPVSRSISSIASNGSVARISLSFWLWGYVKSILDAEQFDIIHLHEPFVPTVPLAVLRHSRTVNVATFHAFGESGSTAYGYSKPILRYFNGKIHGRIAVSRHARDYVNEHFPANYEIIPNGVHAERFSKPQPPIEFMRDGRLNVLFVGRINEQRKGLRYLIRAMPLLKPYFPSLRLVVAGKGDPSEFAEDMAELSPDDVCFVGFVSDEDLPRYYQSADIFCAPSTGGESFGIVLLEAMAAGTPVVAGNIAGYASVLEHGSTGFLAEAKDEYALALALTRLLADAELRRQMGATGKLQVQRYAWEKITRRILAFYQQTTEETLGVSRSFSTEYR